MIHFLRALFALFDREMNQKLRDDRDAMEASFKQVGFRNFQSSMKQSLSLFGTMSFINIYEIHAGTDVIIKGVYVMKTKKDPL